MQSLSHVLTALCVAAAAMLTPSYACTPLTYVDEVRYADGDLAEQIARRAHTIQIVEVRERYLLSRHSISAEVFWLTGRRPASPDGAERYRDIYVFDLEPVETLKGGGNPALPVRARAFDVSRDPTLWQSLGGMVAQILDEPAPERRLIQPVVTDPYGNSSCDIPIALAVGDRYLVLRDERGNVLVPESGTRDAMSALTIDIENVRTRERYMIPAPGVMRVESAPEFIARIRAAVERQPN